MSRRVNSRFEVGELVQHTVYGYRGVIVDIDPNFMKTDAWYLTMARSLPPRDRPWYHVLVDGCEHIAYVSERNLKVASDRRQIEHPLLGRYFDRYTGRRYLLRARAG